MAGRASEKRPTSSWDGLARELDAWAAVGRPATLWWRDDDAVEPSPALDRLLDIAAQHDLPLALAIIPAAAGRPLAARLAEAAPRHLAVLQHGYAHANHAPNGAKKAELGADRPADRVLDELRQGRARMDALFKGRAVARPPVLVPPWNRIAGEVTGRLGEAGFAGLSTFNPRPRALAAPGLTQVNTHVDIVDWRGSRGFVGEAAALGQIVAHLAARRAGAVDSTEPTGVMTHHLVHDEGCWAFMAALAAWTARRRDAVWLDATTIFNMPATGNTP